MRQQYRLIKLTMAICVMLLSVVSTTVSFAASKHNLRKVVIVIDPGHGGKDPGAIAVNKMYEKNVTLSVAKDVAKLINHTFGMKAVLTRSSDKYLSLYQRLWTTRKHKADYFIAIHADAAENRLAHGATVYAISNKAANVVVRRWLTVPKNHEELMGGIDLQDKNPNLKKTLVSLAQNANTARSISFANSILTHLDDVTKLRHKAVSKADFLVLKQPDIPSVLVECGYLSNKVDAANLGSAAYREKIAKAVYQGIKEYVYSHPPRYSAIDAAIRGKITVKVKRGDSLSRLASHYHVSVKQLMSNNHLRNANIRVGQTLRIPGVV